MRPWLALILLPVSIAAIAQSSADLSSSRPKRAPYRKDSFHQNPEAERSRAMQMIDDLLKEKDKPGTEGEKTEEGRAQQ